MSEDVSRRTFLLRSFAGIGGMALSQLFANNTSMPYLRGQGGIHFPAKAKRIIHLCMAGGPSHSRATPSTMSATRMACASPRNVRSSRKSSA